MKKKNVTKMALVMACLGATSLFAGCGTTTAPQKAEIGLVDSQLIMEAHPNMATARQAMDEEYAQIQNELVDTKNLPSDQRKAKVDEFRKRLADKEKLQMVPIKESTERAVNTVMEKNGMTAVFEKKAAIAGGKDITKEVLMQEGLSEQDADAAIEKYANAAVR